MNVPETSVQYRVSILLDEDLPLICHDLLASFYLAGMKRMEREEPTFMPSDFVGRIRTIVRIWGMKALSSLRKHFNKER
jgi:hypothetical protein